MEIEHIPMDTYMKSTRESILTKAKACVCGDREEDYGTPENSFKAIGAMWEAYLRAACIGWECDLCIEPKDVAALLAMLKLARIATGNPKEDNWVDLAGYAACGAELEATRNDA